MADRPGLPAGHLSAQSRDPRDSSGSHPTELLPSYALDALEDEERAAVEGHLATCAACRAEVAGLIAAADALAASVAPVAPPPAARQRLMARVAADLEQVRTERLSAVPAVDSPRRARPAPGAGRTGLGVWVASTVSVASLAVAAFAGGQALDARRQAALTRAELRTQLDALAELNAGSTARVSAVRGTAAAPGATGQLVYQPGGRTAVALVDRLPALQPGRVYQLWLLRGNTPAPAGTLTLDETGRGHAILRAPDRLESYTGIGLTAEPSPNLPAPTGQILATAALGDT